MVQGILGAGNRPRKQTKNTVRERKDETDRQTDRQTDLWDEKDQRRFFYREISHGGETEPAHAENENTVYMYVLYQYVCMYKGPYIFIFSTDTKSIPYLCLFTEIALSSFMKIRCLFFRNSQNTPVDEWVNNPIFVVNQLSHGPILVLEDVNISFFLSFFLSETSQQSHTPF